MKTRYILTFVATAVLVLTACGEPTSTAATPKKYPIVTGKGEQKKVVGEYTIPDDLSISKESNADEIRYGRLLLDRTHELLPQNVGNDLNCNSCHIAGGKVPGGNPYINSYNAYPRFMPRPAKVISLEQRINGCFQRSMNGKVIDPKGSEMNAMVAYMKWLGQGVPKNQYVDITSAVPIDQKLVADPDRGKVLYDKNCVACHGINGEGQRDQLGVMAFPPLWGDRSFNIGAGLARTYKAAAFIKAAMPMGVQSHGGVWGEGDSLSDQDAVDIAEYFTHQARPDFAGKENDWPEGKKPKDARY